MSGTLASNALVSARLMERCNSSSSFSSFSSSRATFGTTNLAGYSLPTIAATASARSTASAPSSAGFLAHISATSAFGSRTLRRIIDDATASRSNASLARRAGFTSPRSRRAASGGHSRSSRSRFERRDSRDTPASSATAPSASSSSCSRDKPTWCSCTERPIKAQGAAFSFRDRAVASASPPESARADVAAARLHARADAARRESARVGATRALASARYGLFAHRCAISARPPLRTRGRCVTCVARHVMRLFAVMDIL